MTDLRKAAEMALNYFENAYELDSHEIEIRAELRQALAQQEQEPVGYVIRMTGQYHTGDFCGEFQSRTALKQGQVLYTAPPKREWKGLTADAESESAFAARNEE